MFVFGWFWQCYPDILQKNTFSVGEIPGILGLYAQIALDNGRPVSPG